MSYQDELVAATRLLRSGFVVVDDVAGARGTGAAARQPDHGGRRDQPPASPELHRFPPTAADFKKHHASQLQTEREREREQVQINCLFFFLLRLAGRVRTRTVVKKMTGEKKRKERKEDKKKRWEQS